MAYKIFTEDGSYTIDMDLLEKQMKERHDALVCDPLIVKSLHKWLGKSGVKLFKEFQVKYGEVCPVFLGKHNIPHPVHLREGMQIRNFLRELPECKGWTHDQFEEDYVKYIEEAIK